MASRVTRSNERIKQRVRLWRTDQDIGLCLGAAQAHPLKIDYFEAENLSLKKLRIIFMLRL